MTEQDDQTLDFAVNAETPDSTADVHNDERCKGAYHIAGLVDQDCNPLWGGWKSDGTPRRKPGPRQSGSATPKKTIPRKSPTVTPKKQKSGTDYRPGILGLIQIPAFALGAAGQMNPALALDGAALSLYAPGIAEALNDLAADNPAVAAALDQVLSVGPYGAILGACLPLAFQIAANHKKIPDAMAKSVGAMPASEFEAFLIAQHSA